MFICLGEYVIFGARDDGPASLRFACGGRAHAASTPAPVRPGRADGERAPEHPRPEPAAGVAPPEIAVRGRAARAVPRGELGVLPGGARRRGGRPGPPPRGARAGA